MARYTALIIVIVVVVVIIIIITFIFRELHKKYNQSRGPCGFLLGAR